MPSSTAVFSPKVDSSALYRICLHKYFLHLEKKTMEISLPVLEMKSQPHSYFKYLVPEHWFMAL